MFNSISGEITHKDKNYIYLLTEKIEWDIKMPTISISILPSLGTECRIFTYLHHTEASMKIFGFSSIKERSLFLDLISVNGIGPNQAIKILSGISTNQFLTILDAEDINSLVKIPGLGKKTAQKIILALKDKLKLIDDNIASENPVQKEMTNALSEMGFDKKKAEKIITKLYNDLKADDSYSDSDIEKELFKKAIVELSS